MNKDRKKLAKINDSLGEHAFYDADASGDEIFASSLKRRFWWGVALAIFFFVVLLFRLFDLQVRQGFLNLKLAEGNRTRNIPVAAPRGLIVSKDGEPLVSNETVYDLVTQLAKPGDLDEIGEEVFDLIEVSREEVARRLESRLSAAQLLTIREKIPREEALLLKSRLVRHGGFEVIPNYTRSYFDKSFCHILGYTGKVSKEELAEQSTIIFNKTSGKSGLEKVYDSYLQGKPGWRRAEVDAKGRIVRILSVEEPSLGNTLVVSIDKELQLFTHEVLKKVADEHKTSAVAIAIEPGSGEIMALASVPDYDCSALSLGISEEDYQRLAEDKSFPLLNRAVSGGYPPGSAIKPFIGAAALEAGVVDPKLAFDTPPEIVIGQWRFPDWKDHGVTNITRAIAESNNVFFYALGGGWGPIKSGLGAEGIKEGLERFHFGGKTGVDLTAERGGFIPTPQWKREHFGENWYIGNTYHLAIGQGDLLVTPMQIASATAALANAGRLITPHFVSQITSPEGERLDRPKEEGAVSEEEVLSSSNAEVIKEGMRMAVTEGSARLAFAGGFPVEVSGKTGTAQFGPAVDGKTKTHAWFTAFAPHQDPKIVVTVMVEGAGEGHQVAAPIAREIIQRWHDLRYDSSP